jgi:hypothetical protein
MAIRVWGGQGRVGYGRSGGGHLAERGVRDRARSEEGKVLIRIKGGRSRKGGRVQNATTKWTKHGITSSVFHNDKNTVSSRVFFLPFSGEDGDEESWMLQMIRTRAVLFLSKWRERTSLAWQKKDEHGWKGSDIAVSETYPGMRLILSSEAYSMIRERFNLTLMI